MNTEETGMLKICKVSLKLNENVSPAYYQARKLVLLIIMKLRKLVEQGLKHVSPGGSKQESFIVDRDLQICGNYRVGLKHKVCSYLYLIPKVEVSILTFISRNENLDEDRLEPAYHQIPIDDYFQEVMAINMPIGLLRWTNMQYGIKMASAISQRTIEQFIGNDIQNIVLSK